MSYSLNSPCYNCSKKTDCTDEAELRKAIQEIHNRTKETGHMGSGQIVLACCVQNK